jgi:hypothetical protein
MVDMENKELAQLKWSNFKDIFKEEYTIQTNDRFIMAGQNLGVKWDLIHWVTDSMLIIKVSYAEYGNKVPEEQNDLNIGVTNATLRKYITLPT